MYQFEIRRRLTGRIGALDFAARNQRGIVAELTDQTFAGCQIVATCEDGVVLAFVLEEK